MTTLQLGSFKNLDDMNRQLTNYKQLLQAQIRNAKRNEDLFSHAFDTENKSIPLVQPMQYKNAEQEESDKNLQYQKAFQMIQNLFKYPSDAKSVMDSLSENYNLSDVNRFFPTFLGELKTTNLTPRYFLSQWDRFYTRLQSQGDNLIQVGIQDDRARYFLQQDANKILKFVKSEGNLTPLQLRQVQRKLNERIQKIGLGEIKEDTDIKNFSNAVDEYNKGAYKIIPEGETLEEKKSSIQEQQSQFATRIIDDIVRNLGVSTGIVQKIKTGPAIKLQEQIKERVEERVKEGEVGQRLQPIIELRDIIERRLERSKKKILKSIEKWESKSFDPTILEEKRNKALEQLENERFNQSEKVIKPRLLKAVNMGVIDEKQYEQVLNNYNEKTNRLLDNLSEQVNKSINKQKEKFETRKEKKLTKLSELVKKPKERLESKEKSKEFVFEPKPMKPKRSFMEPKLEEELIPISEAKPQLTSEDAIKYLRDEGMFQKKKNVFQSGVSKSKLESAYKKIINLPIEKKTRNEMMDEILGHIERKSIIIPEAAFSEAAIEPPPMEYESKGEGMSRNKIIKISDLAIALPHLKKSKKYGGKLYNVKDIKKILKKGKVKVQHGGFLGIALPLVMSLLSGSS